MLWIQVAGDLCSPLPLPDPREIMQANTELQQPPSCHTQEVQSQPFFQACNTSSPWQSGTLLGLAWRAAELEVCKSLLLMVGEILISNVMMAACNLPHVGCSLTKALVTFHVYKGRNSW